MDLDKILDLAKRLKLRFHRSQQRVEYMASLLALEHTVGKPRFELLAEIDAVHSLRKPATVL